MSENKLVTLAKQRIQMLFAAGCAAIGFNDLKRYQLASSQLDESSQDIAIPAEARTLANKRHQELASLSVDEGLKRLERIVAELGPASIELTKAIDIATAGQGNLTVPAAAKAAEKALDSFEKVQKSVAKVKTDLEAALAAKDAGELPERFNELMDDLKDLSDTLQKAPG